MREYCCINCGLIWFSEQKIGLVCKECGNGGLYACDTISWYYASKGVEEMLKKRGQKIHYHKEHPWYGK